MFGFRDQNKPSVRPDVTKVMSHSGSQASCNCAVRTQSLTVSSRSFLQPPLSVPLSVDKTDYMVGSYGPRPAEEYEFLTTMEEAPKGILARGTYNIKSKFTDDDKYDHLSWEWSLTIKKDWKDWPLPPLLHPAFFSIIPFLFGMFFFYFSSSPAAHLCS